MFQIRATIISLIVIGTLFACHEEPDPLLGVEMDRDFFLRQFRIEEFTKNDSILTPWFENVILEFDVSGRLFVYQDLDTFEALWSFRSTTISLSVDVPDSILRELSGIYVAPDYDSLSTQIDLVNQNSRTPSDLILVFFP